LVINFLARCQEATLDVLMASQHVQALRKLPHQPLAGFQLDVMPLAIGHGAPGFQTRPAWKSPRLVRNLVYQTTVSIGILVFFDEFKSRRAFHPAIYHWGFLVIFQSECFESSKVRDYQQCVLHSSIGLRTARPVVVCLYQNRFLFVTYHKKVLLLEKFLPETPGLGSLTLLVATVSFCLL
jgi:hypothetical protein